MKQIKTAALVILVLCMLFSLCACGGSDAPVDDPILGIYHGVACEAYGFYGNINEIYDGECHIELKKNGKCVVTLEDEDFDAKYTLEGEALNIIIEGLGSPGTLKDGILCIDFMELGANLYFVKEGVDVPEHLLSGGDDGSDSYTAGADDDGTIVYQNAKAVYLGSEILKDYSGADTLAVYFDFTHSSDSENSFGWSYYYTFMQGDVELESTSVFPDDDSTELADDVYTDIAPGEHIEVCLTYLLNDTTTPVTISFTNLMSDVIDELTIELSESDVSLQEVPGESYTLYAVEMDDEFYGYEELLELDVVDTTYAILNPDGTGSICFDGELTDLTYDDDTFYSPDGDTLDYSINDGFLIVSNGETVFTFIPDSLLPLVGADIPTDLIDD